MSEDKPWGRDRSKMYVNVSSDGIVRYSMLGVYMTPCDTDLTNYPFDSQTCEINLESIAYR